MSEQTICYSCGGRIYEHAPACRLLEKVGAAIDELSYQHRNDFVGSRVYAAYLIERLQSDGIVVHLNQGECYIGDRLLAKVPAAFGPILKEDVEDFYGGIAPEGREVV